MPEEDKAPETVESVTAEEVKAEAVEDKKVEDASAEIGASDLESRIADRVYDRMKGFVGELMKSSAEIGQMVSETVAAKQEEIGDAATSGAPETAEDMEDVKPKRSHKLFARRRKD